MYFYLYFSILFVFFTQWELGTSFGQLLQFVLLPPPALFSLLYTLTPPSPSLPQERSDAFARHMVYTNMVASSAGANFDSASPVFTNVYQATVNAAQLALLDGTGSFTAPCALCEGGEVDVWSIDKIGRNLFEVLASHVLGLVLLSSWPVPLWAVVLSALPVYLPVTRQEHLTTLY
jgi:hypothetical protein